MKTQLTLAALSAALLIGTASIAANAAGITVGGGNGSIVSGTIGNNSVNVGTSNTSGPLATVTNSGSATGNGSSTDANINLGNLNGNGGSAGSALASVDNNGNLTGDDSSTTGTVDLGSLLNGIDLGGLGGIGGGLPGTGGNGGGNGGNGGNGGGTGVAGGGANGGGGSAAIFASLSAGDQGTLRARCRAIIADPSIYKPDVVNFCRMVAKL
ncbi:MAG: hypothetical protein WDM94_09935 [Bauldia sp.]